MKTLHVHSGNLFGGVERILETLAAFSATAGFETSVALCFQGRLSARLSEHPTRVHDLGVVRASRPWQIARAQARLRRLLDATAPDVIVTHSDWSHGLFGPVALSRRVPVVRWLHAPEAGPAWQARLAERVPPEVLICNSEYTRATASTRFPGVRREVVYPPLEHVAPSNRATTRVAFGVGGETTVILVAARLEPWKGHRALLTALARMHAAAPWEAWVAAGPQRADEHKYLEGLRHQAETEGIAGRVRFLGERDDLPRLMAAADIYCQPNEAPEPFGMSVVEALSAGLPAVVPALGAFPEIVTPACGVLVAPGSTADLASVLSRLVEDAGQRSALRAGALARGRALVDLPGRLTQLREALSTATDALRLAEV
jgi:glycosyltransferase involved in cell wall biosynthesis